MAGKWMSKRKIKKGKQKVENKIKERMKKMEYVGEGAYFEALRDGNKVVKYLKPEKYFYNERVDYDPENERKSYLHRLKILLETEKNEEGSRIKQIEKEFRERFGKDPGKYEFMISTNTGIAVRPIGEWTKDEIHFFNNRLMDITKSELKFIDRLDKSIWELVRDSGVNIVDRKQSEIDPELGIIEKYEYGGTTFHNYWLKHWDSSKKSKLFKEMERHLSDILKQSLKTYEKHGVGIDAHPSNWTIDEHKRVRYVDFEPNSVSTDPEAARTRLIAALTALYMDVGYITKDKHLLKKVRELFINHAKKHVSVSFARELDQHLSKSEVYLSKSKII